MEISSYEFGRIVIGSAAYSSDVIIHPGRVEDNWWRKSGHSLVPEDLESVWPSRPQCLVVGTGCHGRMNVPEETRSFIAAKGIAFHAAPTGEAVELFNRLAAEGKERVVAALHLTC